MSISPKSPTTPASLGVLQLIVGMMTAGVVALLVISVVVHSADDSPKEPLPVPVLSYLAIACAVAALSARAVVPNLMGAGAIKKVAASESNTEAETFVFRSIFAARTVIAVAIIESAALLAGIAYLIEGTLLSLAVALVMVVVLALHFPRRAGRDDWISRQLERIAQERSFGG